MPNWCSNNIYISGDAITIDMLWQHMNADGEVFEADLMNIKPLPEDIGDDWYGWALQNWGTKWSMSISNVDRHVVQGTSGISIQGDTAWSPPLALLEFIANQYDVRCDITFSEEGMDFCGAAVYVKGNSDVSESHISDYTGELDENDPDWYDAYLTALDIAITTHEDALKL